MEGKCCSIKASCLPLYLHPRLKIGGKTLVVTLKASRTAMEEEPLEERISQLLQTVLKNEAYPSIQEEALQELRSLIPSLPKIWWRYKDEIHQEALNEAISKVDFRWVKNFVYPRKKAPIDFNQDESLEICQKLTKYFNGMLGNLKKRIETRKAREQKRNLSLDSQLPDPEDSGETFVNCMTSGDVPWNPNPTPEGIEALVKKKARQYHRMTLCVVKADPKAILRNIRSRKYPQLHCYELVKSRMLDGEETWEETALRLGVKYNTLVSFWQRKKPEVNNYIQSIYQKIEDSCGEAFLNYIKTDPEDALKNCSLDESSRLNAQILARCYFCEEEKLFQSQEDIFGELAAAFSLSESAIAQFWEEECLPLLGEILYSYLYPA
jgi:hypothetical protein